MARETRPPEDFDPASRYRQVEMAVLMQMLRVLQDVQTQAEREKHPIRRDLQRTRAILHARYQRLRAEDDAREGPEDDV